MDESATCLENQTFGDSKAFSKRFAGVFFFALVVFFFHTIGARTYSDVGSSSLVMRCQQIEAPSSNIAIIECFAMNQTPNAQAFRVVSVSLNSAQVLNPESSESAFNMIDDPSIPSNLELKKMTASQGLTYGRDHLLYSEIQNIAGQQEITKYAAIELGNEQKSIFAVEGNIIQVCVDLPTVQCMKVPLE
jgi:hypothetical protein